MSLPDALAALAFGAVSAVAHGLGERSRFVSSERERSAPPERRGTSAG